MPPVGMEELRRVGARVEGDSESEVAGETVKGIDLYACRSALRRRVESAD